MELTVGQMLEQGVAAHNAGNPQEAERIYRAILQIQPKHPDANHNLGLIAVSMDQSGVALPLFKNAVKVNPNIEQFWVSYIEALITERQFENAKRALKQGKKKGVAKEKIKALTQKLVSVKAGDNLMQAPSQAEMQKLLNHYQNGQYGDAERLAISITETFPEHQFSWKVLGALPRQTSMKAEALNANQKAVQLMSRDAEAHHNLSFTLLHNSRLEEGLDEYEWRWQKPENMPKYRHFSQPLWDGKESLQGKRILLWSEQGIGDTLNWASCLPLVAAQTEHIILECQEKIVPLLARSFPNVEIRPEDRSMDSQRGDFDFHLPMGSLYRHFIPHISQNSNIDAYLIPDPARVEFWRGRLKSLGKGPYVGISWKSSEVNPFRLKHYPSISEWSSVLKVPDVTFINLQYSDFVDDLAKIKSDFGVTVHNFDDLDQYNNVDDVAALCAALDMAVSTKVTPMIFSSGVGTPTKIANWRQSIWNTVLTNPVCSSIEMFHRDTWEPWDEVFELIAREFVNLKDETN